MKWDEKAQRKQMQGLQNRADAYAKKVSKVFNDTVNKLLSIASKYNIEKDEVFSFSSNKRLEKQVQLYLKRMHTSILVILKDGITSEWDNANAAIDLFLKENVGAKYLSNPHFASWMNRNTQALNSIIKRTRSGMALSDAVWRNELQLRSELEAAITLSIGEGKTAKQISKQVMRYLNNTDRLIRDVKSATKEDGTALFKRTKDLTELHPGKGVYRDARKNAMRLARSETNMAYRSADNLRWREFEFVRGLRVHLSHNHPEDDICNELQGDYPKDFEFVGWHPNCTCFATPITISNKQFIALQQAKLNGEDYDLTSTQICNPPNGFASWVKHNSKKLQEGKLKQPYFVRDNRRFIIGVSKNM